MIGRNRIGESIRFTNRAALLICSLNFPTAAVISVVVDKVIATVDAETLIVPGEPQSFTYLPAPIVQQ